MPTKITIDPITRIEGHLKIEATIDDGVVKDARSSGMLFRGFELILQGREPRDAQMITLRVCGVCPTAHATASTLNLDSAFGIADQIPDNLLWGHRQRIKDAFNGRGGGTVWVQNPPFDPVENRQQLYQMVESSGL